MAKLPSIQFYPGDWRKDPGVQALSYEERGVWFEMILLMFESGERGKLVLNGNKMPDEALAQTLGLLNQKCNQIVTKLVAYGVAKVEDETGIIFCSRMVKDENLRKIRQDAGKQGGNPNLLKQKSSKSDFKSKKLVNQITTPSSSSSSSLKDKKTSCPAKYTSTPEDRQVAGEVLELARSVTPDLKEPNHDSWANEIRLLRTTDKKSHEQIRARIRWVITDDFWRINIQSPAGLRRNWDKMSARANVIKEKTESDIQEEEYQLARKESKERKSNEHVENS